VLRLDRDFVSPVGISLRRFSIAWERLRALTPPLFAGRSLREDLRSRLALT